MKTSIIAAALAGAVALAVAGVASATTFTAYSFSGGPGATNTKTSSGYQVSIPGTSGSYAGIAINPSAGFTLGDLKSFSFQYNLSTGSYASGTPRIFLYCSGTSACDSGAQAGFVFTFDGQGNSGNTGNIVTSSALDAGPNGNGFGTCAASTGDSQTFAAFVTCAGASTVIPQFGIILDSSASMAQTLDISSLYVNGENLTAVPEPAELGMMSLGLLLMGGLVWGSRKKDRRREEDLA